MYTILVIAIIIVIIVLLISLVTTSKAYQYKHTIDSIEDNPYINNLYDANKESSEGNKNKE